MNEQFEEEEIFEVEELIDDDTFLTNSGSEEVRFRVRWRGFGPEHDTWEPIEHLDGCPDIVERYFDRKDRQMHNQNSNQHENKDRKHSKKSKEKRKISPPVKKLNTDNLKDFEKDVPVRHSQRYENKLLESLEKSEFESDSFSIDETFLEPPKSSPKKKQQKPPIPLKKTKSAKKSDSDDDNDDIISLPKIIESEAKLTKLDTNFKTESPKSKSNLEAKHKSETKTKSETKIKSETKAKTKTKVKSETKSEKKSKSKTKADTKDSKSKTSKSKKSKSKTQETSKATSDITKPKTRTKTSTKPIFDLFDPRKYDDVTQLNNSPARTKSKAKKNTEKVAKRRKSNSLYIFKPSDVWEIKKENANFQIKISQDEMENINVKDDSKSINYMRWAEEHQTAENPFPVRKMKRLLNIGEALNIECGIPDQVNDEVIPLAFLRIIQPEMVNDFLAEMYQTLADPKPSK